MLRSAPVTVALALWISALVWIFGAEPRLNRLAADYEEETVYEATARSRDTPHSTWDHVKLSAYRVDHTMVSTAERSMIQSDLYWSLPDGTVFFENSGIYGVDRTTRENLAGFGNASRSGQFLMPAGADGSGFSLWDSAFIGPRAVTFDRAESVAGLETHVYRFTVRALDETEGYGHLPDVPERYRALTDGEGTISIEPLTGRVVDYHERGRSYFGKPDGSTAGDFFVWSARLDPEARKARLEEAIAARRMRIWLKWGVPALLVLGGAIVLLGWRRSPGEAVSP